MPDGVQPSIPGAVNPSAPDGGGVIILEPGDEKAQKIAKAIASRTAGEILQLLKDGSHASTQIAESLKIPITTVQYHLENLVEAGIITVVEKRWSQKGREVKIYGLRDRMLIVVPRGGDLKGILLRYGSLFAVVILASLVLTLLGPAFAPVAAPALQGALPTPLPRAPPETGAGTVADHVLKEAANQTTAPAAIPVTGAIPGMETVPGVLPIPLVFFLGGALVILVMLGYELWKYRERKG
ncbi:MAG TPA: winged helix-turn-helix domain-containing protein [Methanomicrobiales archaeon]|nr:winged helix-turn-helix domain-containing protein [Methanomicrobiales archaeon]